MKQMVSVGIATYKESTRESTIDLIFAILLFTDSFITYDIAGDFHYNSDHQPILFK